MNNSGISEKEEFIAKIIIIVFLIMVIAVTSFFVFMVLSDRPPEPDSQNPADLSLMLLNLDRFS